MPEENMQDDARTELYQALADQLSALIVQKGSEVEANEAPAQPENPAYRRKLAWALGAIAAGGGIYMETLGGRWDWFGSSLLAADVVLGVPQIYSNVICYITRRRAGL